MLMFFAFGFYHIGRFVTADEHYWVYERIPQYWRSIESGNWKKTKINDKPGITVALISGIGMLKEKNPENHYEKIDRVDIFDSDRSEKFYLFFRLPIFLFSLFMSVYLFWVLKKIFKNGWLALWGLIFIILSPILVGMSQIINPDALLWSVSAAAIFSFFALFRTREKKFIFLCGFFTALALLSKYTANILFIFYFTFIFINYFFNYKEEFKDKADNVADYFRKNLLFLGLIFALACLFFAFFMPAAIRNPKHLYLGTLGSEVMSTVVPFLLPILVLFILDSFFFKAKILIQAGNIFDKYRKYILSSIFFAVSSTVIFVLINRIGQFDWLRMDQVPIDAKSDGVFSDNSGLFKKIILEFCPLVFSLTPAVLFLALISWIKRIWTDKENIFDIYIFSLTIFSIIFISGAIFSDLLLTPRYLIILYPLFGLLAAVSLFEWLEKFKIFSKKVIISFLILGVGLYSLWLAKPFYYSYSSFLLPKKYIVSDAWGFGGYEAASYLNSLPDSRNLTIWADYYGVCEFFHGKCSTDYKFNGKVDYYVLTRRGQIRFQEEASRAEINDWSIVEAEKYYDFGKKSEWSLFLNNRSENFIKIFKSN